MSESAFFEFNDGAVYISNGASRMVRVSADGVVEVDAGTDGVCFREGAVLEPWVLGGCDEGVDPFESCEVFGGMAAMSEADRLRFKLWVLALPVMLGVADEQTPVPLALVGAPGSGKSVLAKAVCWLLGLPERVVVVRSEGEMWDMLVEPGVLHVDDVRWKSRSFKHVLAAYASGHRVVREGRELNPLSALMMTMVAKSSEERDLVFDNRVQWVEVFRENRMYKSEAELREQVEYRRHEGLTWMAWVLARAIVTGLLKTEFIELGYYRFPGFVGWALRLALALGELPSAVLGDGCMRGLRV